MSNRVSELAQRIKLLRLPQGVIAERSGLNIDTVNRTFLRGPNRTDPLNSTLDRIEAVLEAEEETVREALTKKGAAA